MALVALLVAAFGASSASAIGISNWEAGTCAVPGCTYGGAPGEFFSQAAGHPPDGITDFSVNVEGGDQVKRVKVELPEGLNVNPQAVPQCSIEDFQADACPAASQVGVSKVVSSVLPIIPIEAAVYDLVPKEAEPALFAFHVSVPLLVSEFVYLETAIEWTGDYHESFFINNIAAFPPLESNRLTFNGQAGGNFLTLPSPCNGNSSSLLEIESQAGATAGPQKTTPPVPISGCGAVPFKPAVAAVANGPTDSSVPVSVTLDIPQHPGATELNTSTVKTANVTLPTYTGLNPATAPGLKFCPDNAFPLHSHAATSCPAESQIGTIAIEAPELPAGSLKGPVYLATQKSREPLSGQEYRVFFNAESARYGVQVREEGRIKANPTTGQITGEFTELPQVASGTGDEDVVQMGSETRDAAVDVALQTCLERRNGGLELRRRRGAPTTGHDPRARRGGIDIDGARQGERLHETPNASLVRGLDDQVERVAVFDVTARPPDFDPVLPPNLFELFLGAQQPAPAEAHEKHVCAPASPPKQAHQTRAPRRQSALEFQKDQTVRFDLPHFCHSKSHPQIPGSRSRSD